MLRILLTLLIGAGLGWGLGHLQASMATSGFEERFVGARPTAAEAKGETATAQVAARAKGTPKLEIVGGRNFNFGTMQHGDSMSHSFVFRNVGDGPLDLEMGHSTCKCTVGELDSSVLQPGQETEVTLTWTPTAEEQHFAQTATIHTNAPGSPEVQLEVEGQVAGSFVIEPKQLALGDIAVTDRVTRKLHVFTYLERCKELKDLQWTDQKTASKVKLEVHELELDPEKFPDHKNAFGVHEIDVTLEPGLNLGSLSSKITFATDQGEELGTFEVPVTGRVTGDFTFVGGPSFDSRLNALRMGTVKSSEGAKITMSVVVQGEQRDQVDLQVASVKPADVLNVNVGEVKSVGSRKFFPLEFEVPKGAPETYLSGANPKDFGTVVLTTNTEPVKEISIHFQLNIVK